MRSFGSWAGCVLLVACSSSSSSTPAKPDAYDPGGGITPMCTNVRINASCNSGLATVVTSLYGMGAGSHSMCSMSTTATARCTTACAVDFSVQRDWPLASQDYLNDPLYRLTGAPSLLCAETPAAQAGDGCDVPVGEATPPERRCLPTRAQLGSDGNVTGQDYLACSAASVCATVPAPQVQGYLQACDAAVTAQYGGSGIEGAVVASYPACLIAWDAGMQRVLSGRTIECTGDWDCPEGALCDDQLMLLDMPGQRLGVCKPGPRGSLAMTPLVPT